MTVKGKTELAMSRIAGLPNDLKDKLICELLAFAIDAEAVNVYSDESIYDLLEDYLDDGIYITKEELSLPYWTSCGKAIVDPKEIRLRRQSRKRRALMDEVRDERNAFIKAANGKCMWCNSKFGVAVHEILRGANRNKALSEPCTWLVLCAPCNTGQFHSRDQWPDSKQLALQYLRCPGVYDLKRFNWLYCERAPNRVTQEEVDYWIGELTK